MILTKVFILKSCRPNFKNAITLALRIGEGFCAVLCMKSLVHCWTSVASKEHASANARLRNHIMLQARADLGVSKRGGDKTVALLSCCDMRINRSTIF